MWPGYIPGGTGPIGVGSIPGVTEDGPAPSYRHKMYVIIMYLCKMLKKIKQCTKHSDSYGVKNKGAR